MIQQPANKRHRIVYVMNVDWGWVKQRPHFLAQHLSRLHDVVVIYPYAWRRRQLAMNDRKDVRLYPFFRIPFGRKCAFIASMNICILRMMAKVFLGWFRPTIIWISSPELFGYLPRSLSAHLVYDCMDDVLGFPINKSQLEMLAANEKELVDRSTVVFCSSNNLRDKLIQRTGQAQKCFVIHNAFEPSAFSTGTGIQKVVKKEERYALGYIGTISSWVDLEALLAIVNAYPSVDVYLIGPVENLGRALPEHGNFFHLGVVEHKEIQVSISNLDALIMPFVVNELILSVDPVKLYEYIFFDKPILSVQYPEVEKFAPFVDFYATQDELFLIIERYLKTGFQKKYSENERQHFINMNTWASRINKIQQFLPR